MAEYHDIVLSGNTQLTLSAGDSAYTTVAKNGASVQILSGGYAEGTTLYTSAAMFVSNGGSASATALSAGTGYISSGGAAVGVDILHLGTLTVFVGGTATDLNVSNGKVNAVVGGANNTTLISGTNPNGEFYLKNNVASNFILYMNSWQEVASGGTTCDITVNNSAQLYISSGASATGLIHKNGGQVFYAPIRGGDNETLVTGSNSYGEFYISNGTASGILLCGNCQLPVSNGGVVRNAVINGLQAKMHVYSGGLAEHTRVFNNALEVYSGGVASDTTILASMNLYNGGTALDTVISGGALYTASVQSDEGATQNNSASISGLTVKRRGTLNVGIQTALDGTITIAGTATLNAETTMSVGTELVLDISERTSDDAAIISDFGMISGEAYQMSVSTGAVDQYGFYKLAAGAAGFTGTITVTCGGEAIGQSIGVGESFDIPDEEVRYSLVMNSDVLTLNVVDTEAPRLDGLPTATVKGYAATISWNPAIDKSGISKYILKINDNVIELAGTSYIYSPAAIGTYNYQLRAVDFYNNESDWSALQSFEVLDITPQNVNFNGAVATWDKSPGIDAYVAKLSPDDFSTALTLHTVTEAVDFYNLGVGDYKFKVRADIDDVYSVPAATVVAEAETGAVKFTSNEDGNADLFFAQSSETWVPGYFALHVGTAEWQNGTRESIALVGKNRIANIFYGSTDSSVLYLLDSANGDVLALDDMFTAFPGDEQIARFQSIAEIRGGAGDDVVDLTSTKFASPSMTIRGGDGDDVIWSGDGKNYLFGDAGNDRLVGGAGNDVLCGGAGNDRMHGGGGDDIFTFAGDWGQDIVETTAAGDVTVWFSGIDRADVSLTYRTGNTVLTCGTNSVTVRNRQLTEENLRFGADGYEAQYAELAEMGAFSEYSSERIFEDQNSKAVIASL